MGDLYKWDVEDPDFWESKGKKIANRNLWISIPSLLCGFAVWLYWGIITVQMLNLGFPDSQGRAVHTDRHRRPDRRHAANSQQFLHPHCGWS